MKTPAGTITPPEPVDCLGPAECLGPAVAPPASVSSVAMLQEMSDGMVFVPSERSTVSCGTVCVDPRADRVLILYNRRLDIWQLPKGRKNINEGLPAAALRETYEETGVRARLLPLRVRTRSTPGSADADVDVDADADADVDADDPKLCYPPNNEHIGVVQYPDLQVATPGTVKTVFFFAAAADSTAPLGPGAQEAHEDLQAAWVDFGEADRRLRFGPEKEAMWKVKRDMGATGL